MDAYSNPGGNAVKKYWFLTLAFVLFAGTLAGAGTYLVGGTYTGGNTIPFWATYGGMRWQTIWDKSRITESGAVSKVELITYSTGISTTNTFNTCKILLCHTSLTHVTTSYSGNYSGNTPVTVFSGTKVIPATGGNTWVSIVEPTNFTYNNANNLLIEVSWVTASGYRCDFQVNSRGSHGRIYSNNPNATSGSVTNNYDQLGRITIGYVGVAPTSLGRIKSLYN
jgi:hypothetical protein